MEKKAATSTKKASEKQVEKSDKSVKAKKPSENRKYLTAITIVSGVITLIDSDGTIKYYRQRGITQLPDQFKKMLISCGFLNSNWYEFKELPKDITIHYEDEEIMGRASATYPAKQAAIILKYKGI